MQEAKHQENYEQLNYLGQDTRDRINYFRLFGLLDMGARADAFDSHRNTDILTVIKQSYGLLCTPTYNGILCEVLYPPTARNTKVANLVVNPFSAAFQQRDFSCQPLDSWIAHGNTA